jgi:hypothetical protein
MAQETITEYKTEEYQKTRTLCDNCGRAEEDAQQILTVAINPQERVRESQNLELIKTFEDSSEAHEFMSKRKKAQAFQDISHGLDKQEVWGIGRNHNTKTVNMNASATADLCASCVFDLFGIEIPENEEVEDINLGETEVNIDTTKEVTTIWPQFDIPEWDDSLNGVEDGWKGKIAFWPLVCLFSSSDILFSYYHGEEERQKGYVAGSLGTLAWTSLLFIILYLSSILVFVI